MSEQEGFAVVNIDDDRIPEILSFALKQCGGDMIDTYAMLMVAFVYHRAAIGMVGPVDEVISNLQPILEERVKVRMEKYRQKFNSGEAAQKGPRYDA